MNRWVLLEHKVILNKKTDIHYDFLVEGEKDCLTWKFHNIPETNRGAVEITKSPNHRLVWLTRVEHQLSDNRGLVKRIDCGTYIKTSYILNPLEYKFILNGNLFRAFLTIGDKFCRLTKDG